MHPLRTPCTGRHPLRRHRYHSPPRLSPRCSRYTRHLLHRTEPRLPRRPAQLSLRRRLRHYVSRRAYGGQRRPRHPSFRHLRLHARRLRPRPLTSHPRLHLCNRYCPLLASQQRPSRLEETSTSLRSVHLHGSASDLPASPPCLRRLPGRARLHQLFETLLRHQVPPSI